MVASILKTIQLRVLATADNDPTVATVNMERWLYIETYLVIITASIPCLRSLLRSRKNYLGGGSTYEMTSWHRGSTLASRNLSTRQTQTPRSDSQTHPIPVLVGVRDRGRGNESDSEESALGLTPRSWSPTGNHKYCNIEKKVQVSVYN